MQEKFKQPLNVKVAVQLDEADWDFSSVPATELVACCYWEYARESQFIRETLRRYRESYHHGFSRAPESSDAIFVCMDRIQSIGYASEVIVRGCSFPAERVWQSAKPDAENYRGPDADPITGNFPEPWQKLSREERKCRAHIGSDVERIPLVPFERGHSVDVSDIRKLVEARRREIEAANEKVRRENPKKSEEVLCREGKLSFPLIPPSLYWAGGKEVTVVGIHWAVFTDDEIASYFRKWVKANRPMHIPAPNRRGSKLRDWRVALNRLGVMRALHAYSLADHRFPRVFRERGEKHCYAARKLALKKFQDLFPFLSKSDRPINYATKGGRSK